MNSFVARTFPVRFFVAPVQRLVDSFFGLALGCIGFGFGALRPMQLLCCSSSGTAGVAALLSGDISFDRNEFIART